MKRESLISIDAARTLAHVALLAAWEGNGDAAEQIFAALQAAKPAEPNIRVCRAMVYACQDRFTECLSLLEEVLTDEPRNMSAKSLRGFVLFTLEDPAWRGELEAVIADGSDPASVGLAEKILQDNARKSLSSSSPRSGGPPAIVSYA